MRLAACSLAVRPHPGHSHKGDESCALCAIHACQCPAPHSRLESERAAAASELRAATALGGLKQGCAAETRRPPAEPRAAQCPRPLPELPAPPFSSAGRPPALRGTDGHEAQLHAMTTKREGRQARWLASRRPANLRGASGVSPARPSSVAGCDYAFARLGFGHSRAGLVVGQAVGAALV